MQTTKTAQRGGTASTGSRVCPRPKRRLASVLAADAAAAHDAAGPYTNCYSCGGPLPREKKARHGGDNARPGKHPAAAVCPRCRAYNQTNSQGDFNPSPEQIAQVARLLRHIPGPCQPGPDQEEDWNE